MKKWLLILQTCLCYLKYREKVGFCLSDTLLHIKGFKSPCCAMMLFKSNLITWTFFEPSTAEKEKRKDEGKIQKISGSKESKVFGYSCQHRKDIAVFFFQFFDILIGIDIHVQLFLSEMKYFNEDEFIVSG